MSQASNINNNADLLASLKQLVLQAGEAIMQVYSEDDFGVQTKGDDSPVTKADLAAHHVLVDGLAELTPDIPIVSEEDKDSLAIPRTSSCYWLIDPLDGTKEFINRNGQFTVNLALIENNVPSYGFVSTPVDQTIYWGGKDIGCWRERDDQQTQLICQATATPIRVVASKSHLNEATKEFIDALGETELVQAGSSLKFVRIAEGIADIYPRMAPTCEWDTGAAQAVLEGAGGSVTKANGEAMHYGKEDILNPHFIARNK